MQAVKWLGMDSHGKMAVDPAAAKRVLKSLPADQPINLISIFGAARQGKSFLMNLLANQQDLFRISNEKEPCTQGVDLSSHFVPLTEFSRQNGCPPVQSKMMVGFVDAEGQGDRDITYDSRLVSPVLLSSKVVIFNWKDSLQVDRMLNLLAVLAKAAQNVELAEGENRKVFGHLHIVFRDWNFINTTPEKVFDSLFKKEKGYSSEVSTRNLARHELIDAFESIQIWLFPVPVVTTAQLSERIRFEQLQPSFQSQLRDLRKTLASQLKEPMQFNQQPLTGRTLSEMIPFVADILNENKVIMPESIYSSMRRAEAKKLQSECEEEMLKVCKSLLASDTLISTEAFVAKATDALTQVLAKTMTKLQQYPAEVVQECKKGLDLFLERQLDTGAKANNELVIRHFHALMEVASDSLTTEFTKIERSLPLPPAQLSTTCDRILELITAPLLECPTATVTTYHGEIRRLQQQAQVLKERLQHQNERALRQRTTEQQTFLMRSTQDLKSKGIQWLDSQIQSKVPFTIAMLEAQLSKWLNQIKIPDHDERLDDIDVRQELHVNFTELLEDLKRQYTLHVRHVLHKLIVDTKAAMERKVNEQLGEITLPMKESKLTSIIHNAKDTVVTQVAEVMQGWSFPQDDMEQFGLAMAQHTDHLLEEYGVKNRAVTQDTASKEAMKLYQETKEQLVSLVDDNLTKQMPVEDADVDVIFDAAIEQATSYLMDNLSSSTVTQAEWHKRFHGDLVSVKAQYKALNQKEREKKEWMKAAEAERVRLQQLENQVAHTKALAKEKEEQIKSILLEKEQTSAHLHEELNLQASKTQELEQKLHELHMQASSLAKEKEALRHEAAALAAKERQEKEKAIAEQTRRQANLQRELEALQHQLQQQQQILKQKEEDARIAALAQAKALELEKEKDKAWQLAQEERKLREKMLEDAKLHQAKAEALQNKMSSELEKHVIESSKLQGTLAQEKAKAERLEAELRQARALAAAMEREREQLKQQALLKEQALQHKVQLEAQRRAEAEAAAIQAARAAEAAAKAAVEAAEASPDRHKRKAGSEPKQSRKALKVKAPLPKLSIEEARRQAQEDMEKRIAQRVASLDKTKKHKSKKQ